MHDRRAPSQTFLPRYAALLVPLLCTGCGGSDDPGGAPATRIDNVVVICIDTVRQDVFAALSSLDDALTPYERSAVRFTQAQATAPWTIPSVASVVTGLYPVQHGAGRFEESPAQLTIHLPSAVTESATTFAQILSKQGFATAAFVAHPWFLADFGLQRGFEYLAARKGWEKIAEHFELWLDRRDTARPFLGYIHLMEAHDRHLAGGDGLDAPIAAMTPDRLQLARSLAPNGICDDETHEMCRRFLVYVDSVVIEREAIARVLSALQQRELLESTAVVVFADHGEEFHDHLDKARQLAQDPRGFYGHGHGQSLFQEQLNVPLVIWHPGLPGGDVDTPVSLVDVAPSILHWTGAATDIPDSPGIVLDQVILGQPAAWERHDAPFTPTTALDRPLFASSIGYGYEQLAVRAGDRKAIYYTRDDSYDLFDIGRDPLETDPTRPAMPPYVADRLLGDYLDSATSSEQLRPTVTDDQVESLKSIGYLQGRDTGGDQQ